MGVIVRKYGLLNPVNWDKDCGDHLYLQNKLWNRLVEIEHENRSNYLSIVGGDESVSAISAKIEAIKSSLSEMDAQRKELRKKNRSKQGIHTEPLDLAIKAAKMELKELSGQAKAIRSEAKERIKSSSTALEDNEKHRKEMKKDALNASGLWWGNYNAVGNSYDTARSRAMKEGTELKFHRFDGSGRFTCQVQGGMTTKELLSGAHNIAQIRLVDGSTFTDAARKNPPPLMLQEVGSRRDSRQYGILSITVYTWKDDDRKHHRRMLDFPVILHRPLPEDAVLKELHVNRCRVGCGFEWSVTFTFVSDCDAPSHPSPLTCGINIGWKVVRDGVRIATVTDSDGKTSHITLPADVPSRLEYVDGDLKSRIDLAVNDNWNWLLDCWSGDVPEELLEIRSLLRRSKKPHEGKFAKAVYAWRGCPDFMPEKLVQAERLRKQVRRLSNEFSNLKDKVLRRRLDFYRNVARKLCDKYSIITLDKTNLSEMARLESKSGMPTDLCDKARRNRVVAAVSEFRQWLANQAAKTGTKIENRLIKSTHTCSVCGCAIEPQKGLYLVCSECQTTIDRDENASSNLLLTA